MTDTQADADLAAQYRDAVAEHQGIARMFHEAAERLDSDAPVGRTISLTQARAQLEALSEDSDACALGARALALMEQLSHLPLPNIDPPSCQELFDLHILITFARDLAEGR